MILLNHLGRVNSDIQWFACTPLYSQIGGFSKGGDCFFFFLAPVPDEVTSIHWVLINVCKTGYVGVWVRTIHFHLWLYRKQPPSEKTHFQIWSCTNYTNLLSGIAQTCSVVSGSLFHLVPACSFGVFRTRDIRRKRAPNRITPMCCDGVCFSL